MSFLASLGPGGTPLGLDHSLGFWARGGLQWLRTATTCRGGGTAVPVFYRSASLSPLENCNFFGNKQNWTFTIDEFTSGDGAKISTRGSTDIERGYFYAKDLRTLKRKAQRRRHCESQRV